MQPDTGSKVLYPSFNSPLPLPPQDPNGSPSKAFTIACSWLPYIRGALYQLTQQWSWPQDDPAALLLAQQQAMTLIAMFTECADPLPPLACNYDFASSNTGWTAVSPYLSGSWSPGNGWLSQDIDSEDQGWIYIQRALTTPNTINRVEFTYNSTLVGSGANNYSAVFLDTGSGYFVAEHGTLFAGTNTVVWAGSYDNVVGIRLNVNSGTSEALIKITSAEIRGLSAEGCG